MFKKGDTIKCSDADEAVELMTELQKEGITTDFLYEKDGQKGIWLKVERIEQNGCNKV